MSARRRSDLAGFTLLEVMVAVGVLAISLTALLGLKNRDLAIEGLSREITTATILARQRLMETKLKGFPVLGEESGSFDEPYKGYRWRRVVSGTPFESVREIRLTVTWPAGSREETLSLTTYAMQ